MTDDDRIVEQYVNDSTGQRVRIVEQSRWNPHEYRVVTEQIVRSDDGQYETMIVCDAQPCDSLEQAQSIVDDVTADPPSAHCIGVEEHESSVSFYCILDSGVPHGVGVLDVVESIESTPEEYGDVDTDDHIEESASIVVDVFPEPKAVAREPVVWEEV